MACYNLRSVKGVYKAKGHSAYDEKFAGKGYHFMVPCGRCAFCAVQKRSDWALRLHYEAKKHIGSRFVTLTYADAHLVWKDGKSQLSKSHLQEFFREYRRDGYKMRYYAVGEYGSKTFRPHYHILMFGDIDEERVRKKWPYGHVHVGHITTASVMYCLGYVCNSKAAGMKHHREPPFTLMSRRPGLGANYLTKEMIAWHQSGLKNYAVLDNQKRHLPRYYKEKIFSKIDLVRISVRDQKEAFRQEIIWLRSKKMQRHRDPLAYRDEQRRQAAMQIKKTFKENLKI